MIACCYHYFSMLPLWKMTIIESLIQRKDQLFVHSANHYTSKGKTNQPITKPYPLKLAQSDVSLDNLVKKVDNSKKSITKIRRTVHKATKKAL